MEGSSRKVKTASFLLPFAFLLFTCLLSADTLHVTLDECLHLAQERSPSARAALFDSLAAAGRWRTVQGENCPQLRMSGELPSWQDAVDYELVYDEDTEQYQYRRESSGDELWLGRVDLEQALPWGATVNLSTRLYQSRWHSERFRAGRDTVEYSLRRQVLLNQPLLAGNPVARSRRIGRIGWESDLLSHELRQRDIRYHATQAFFGLVSAREALEIARQDLEQGRSAEELAKRKLQAGLTPEVELLQIQVDLARREGNYRRVEGILEAAMDRLKAELGLPLDLHLEPQWKTEAIRPEAPRKPDTADERLELKREELRITRRELETRAALWQERVRASLQMFYEVDTRRDQLSKLDQPGDRNIGVTLNVELPLYGFGATRGRVEELRAVLALARIDKDIRRTELELELRDAARAVDLAIERIRIAEAALELSQKSYQITAERFDSGLVGSRDLLDAQLDLTRTRTEALNARIDYELALANLERIAP